MADDNKQAKNAKNKPQTVDASQITDNNPSTVDATQTVDAPQTTQTTDNKPLVLTLGDPDFEIPQASPRIYLTDKDKFRNAVVAKAKIPLIINGVATGVWFGAHIIQREAVAPILRGGKKYVSRSWDIKTGSVGRYSDQIDAILADDAVKPAMIAGLKAAVTSYEKLYDANPAVRFNLAKETPTASGAVMREEEMEE